jgi:methionyl aminopeptidase
LTEGLVFTIEPLIAMGGSRTVTLKDGWTVRTRDRSLAAHYEHTVIVTSDGARLLTA